MVLQLYNYFILIRDIMSIYIHSVHGQLPHPNFSISTLQATPDKSGQAAKQAMHSFFRQLSCKKNYKESEPSRSLSAGRGVLMLFWTLGGAVDANIRHTRPVQIAIVEPVAHRQSPSRQTQDPRVLRQRCAIREDFDSHSAMGLGCAHFWGLRSFRFTLRDSSAESRVISRSITGASRDRKQLSFQTKKRRRAVEPGQHLAKIASFCPFSTVPLIIHAPMP